MTTPSNTTTSLSDLVRNVYDRSALFAFRAANVFRAFVDEKRSESDLPMPGNPVNFTVFGALAAVTSAISETVEPTPVAMTDSQVAVTLAEYGNVVKNTRKIRMTSFVNMDIATPREVAANMEESMDLVARNLMITGTNVLRPGGVAKASLLATSVLTAALVRQIRSQLRGANVPYVGGNNAYGAIIHPDTSYDLQGETGQNAWSAPHTYGTDVEAIYSGEIGMYAAFRFIENANAKIDVDAGSGGTVDVYHTLFIGYQAIGEGIGDPQHMVISGPFDDLQRWLNVGWYALLGYAVLRQAALRRIESASSIGAN